MSINKLSYAFLSLLALTFVLFFLNTQLSIKNDKLSSDIDSYKEEKMILRAKYFSNISAKNLTAKASSLGMRQVDSQDVIGISAVKYQSGAVFNSALKYFSTQFNDYLRRPDLIVSGY